MAKEFDCIVCGSCVVDLLCRPVDLQQPIGEGMLYQVDPIEIAAGGITSNAGVTMARLGTEVAVLSYVGNDHWGPIIRNMYAYEGIHADTLMTHPTDATSTTVVAINGDSGERSFFHCVGAPKLIDADVFYQRLDLFARTRMLLLGYYSLLPNLEADLPEVLKHVRETGCQTALDAAGQGGIMSPLDRILPHLDVYVPSYREAKHQTGYDDPRRIIETYRACGAPGLLGVKLGERGVLLSPAAEEYVEVPAAAPPGPVTDTTGAGDSFYGGLLAGLLRGLSVEESGRLGTAAAACCVTAMGGSSGGRDYAFTAKLAGIE